MTRLLDLSPDVLWIVASALDDKAALRATCSCLRDSVDHMAKSLTWRCFTDLHELSANMLSKCRCVNRGGLTYGILFQCCQCAAPAFSVRELRF